MTVKGIRYVKIDSANPLYPIINKINGYSKEDNRNKYLTLVHIDRSKNTVKKYEELCNKIRDLTRPKSNNSDDYDEKYKKIKHNWDDDLPLKKTLELRKIIIIVRVVFKRTENLTRRFS